MFRVTSLATMPDAQLNRLIRRVGLLLLVGLIAFVAFYTLDRWRPAATPIVDRETAALEAAVRADPADTVSRGQLADLYFAQRRFDDAIVQYTALIDAGREVELASLGRARSYEQTAQYELAIPDYEKVVEIASTGEMAKVDPTLAAAYYGLGSIALAQGKPADAIDPLTRALRIQRTDADALNALALAYLQTDQPDQAIEPLTLAVALVPVGWADPYVNLETAYAETGAPELAEWAGAMAAFVGGDPETAESRLLALTGGEHALEASIGLGLVMESKGDTAAAAEWFRRALAIDPQSIPASLGLSRVGGPTTDASAAPAEGSE